MSRLLGVYESKQRGVTMKLEDSREAAIFLMKDAHESRRKTEIINEFLKKEISGCKKTEEALRVSEAHYCTLF